MRCITCYISPGYFCRSFKEALGFSFVEYVNTVREAQRPLRETNVKAVNVAEQAGFESVAHFGCVYKQITKQSPLAYRKRVRGNARFLSRDESCFKLCSFPIKWRIGIYRHF
ncbi:helix-turn-helix domain-containing protein [Paenibacillus hamazuiensis]|uniref:helix-turn-helix domain-containing protein n=1 Tax=Paenibacillus hamazuiensis TaxID=2936508 RepID=UPI00200E67EF|nr:helix-turn-helix transcriptional regulator [Paenibacillus hamazuiensis]